MIRITFYKIFVGVVLCCIASNSNGQSNDSPPVQKQHKFVFYGGFGPNYYFNNLVVAKKKVNEFSYSFVGKLMWEPENNLSLGIESGYNRLYSVDAELGIYTGTINIVNVAIPLQLVACMKFLENYYCSFSFGRAILLNKVSTSDFGKFDASSLSLGDYTLSVGYKRPINNRFLLGAELKGYYSGKLEDKNIALVFMGGVRF